MPAWLEDRIGIDYFRPVTIVVLYDNDAATDATIEQVRRLTRLWRLMLIESSVNDALLDDRTLRAASKPSKTKACDTRHLLAKNREKERPPCGQTAAPRGYQDGPPHIASPRGC